MRKLEFLSLEQSNPQPDKDKILLFMKHSPVIASSPGISKNYLTREHLATEMTVYSAFGYYWTSADIWYYEVYNYQLPNEFVALAKEHYLDHIRNPAQRYL